MHEFTFRKELIFSRKNFCFSFSLGPDPHTMSWTIFPYF